MTTNRMLTRTVLTLAIVALASSVWAGAVLTTGSVEMGVNDDGSLGFGGVGLNLIAGPGDAITPGCLCEGWGAASNGVGSWTYGNSANSGIASSTFMSTGLADAVSAVMLTSGLKVTHTYSSAAGGTLFALDITIENTTGAAMTDVRYARTLDWDVAPGHFTDDSTTIFGGSPAGPAGDVLHTSFDPFAAPNPMVTRGSIGGSPPADTNGTDEPGDLGAYFIISLGDLDPGAMVDFKTFIGADFSTADLLGAFGSVGIEAFSYSWDNDDPEGATFGWGFADVGLPPAIPTPIPGTLALLGIGSLGLFATRRRN